MNAAPPGLALPTCRCGHDRYHPRVHAQMRYGLTAWTLLFQGSSARPKTITFRCGRCGEVVETTRDRQTLEQFRRR
jgi:hypothetical protein